MSQPIRIGDVSAIPGSVQYGRWDAFTFPTGHTEFLPLIVAQGAAPGPCLWLTAGIHGPEHAGPAVIYELLTPALVAALRGTIVAVPLLAPAGIRTMSRTPYHERKNPNRLWPSRRPASGESAPPSPLEQAYAGLFAVIAETADFLIDYHNYTVGALSFAFQDPVLYEPGVDEEAARAAAAALVARQAAMLRAYGHTIIRDFALDDYLAQELHRSTSAAAMLLAGIPAFTAELGVGEVPDSAMIRAGVAGTRNVLRWAGMLDGDPETISGIRVVEPGYAVRRVRAPRVTQACVALFRVDSGDFVQTGDVVAELCDAWGRPLGTAVAPEDGFVISRSKGIFFLAGDPLLSLAVRDDSPLVAPYPPA